MASNRGPAKLGRRAFIAAGAVMGATPIVGRAAAQGGTPAGRQPGDNGGLPENCFVFDFEHGTGQAILPEGDRGHQDRCAVICEEEGRATVVLTRAALLYPWEPSEAAATADPGYCSPDVRVEVEFWWDPSLGGHPGIGYARYEVGLLDVDGAVQYCVMGRTGSWHSWVTGGRTHAASERFVVCPGTGAEVPLLRGYFAARVVRSAVEGDGRP